MTHTVLHWAVSGTDGYGKHTYSTPEELSAMIQKKREMVKDRNGQDIVSDVQVFLSDSTVTFDDFIFLGAEDDLDSSEDTTDPTSISANCFQVVAKYEFLSSSAAIMFIKVWL